MSPANYSGKTIEFVDFTAVNCKIIFFTDGSVLLFEWASNCEVEEVFFENHTEYDNYCGFESATYAFLKENSRITQK